MFKVGDKVVPVKSYIPSVADWPYTGTPSYFTVTAISGLRNDVLIFEGLKGRHFGSNFTLYTPLNVLMERLNEL